MNYSKKFTAVVLIAAIWGFTWALILQFTGFGQFLSYRRTWLTVVIGVGVDLLLACILMPLNAWLAICGVIAASSIGIVARSLINELRETDEVINGHQIS